MSAAMPGKPQRAYGRVRISHARVVERLSLHRGEANAITADDLAVILGVKERDNRSLREVIGEIIEDGLLCVGSTSYEGRPGYFVVETLKELEKVERSLRRRAGEIERRITGLRRAFHAGPQQPALFNTGAHAEPPTAPTAVAPTASTESQDVPVGRRHEERFRPNFREVIARLDRTTPASAPERAQRGAERP